LAVALLLDEWRRATMEGQGGWFVRLPRERYDGEGNLWTVVRRNFSDNEERIVLVCEQRHYQCMAASNEMARIEQERAQALNALSALGFGKGPVLDRNRGFIKENIAHLNQKIEDLAMQSKKREPKEYFFPLDLSGYRFAVEL
jgi:hypothetical protein